jgi:sulfur-oxidizing protein SoxB
MTLYGKPIDANKKYQVAGWASIRKQPEDMPQIWDTVSDYLRNKKTIRISEPNVPKILGLGKNPGYVKI